MPNAPKKFSVWFCFFQKNSHFIGWKKGGWQHMKVHFQTVDGRGKVPYMEDRGISKTAISMNTLLSVNRH